MKSSGIHIEGKTILVTGAGGFIGSALVDFLLSQSARVRALLGVPGEPVWNPRSPAQIFHADIRELPKMREYVRGVDVVVHLAGPPSVQASFQFPSEYAAVHTLGTATIMEACQKECIPRIVYLSSAEVYGRPTSNPVTEDASVSPLSPYATAKVAAEVFVRTMAAFSIMDAVILRPFSVYGPRLSSVSLIANILEQIRGNECVSVRDLTPVRDYCYVKDVVEAVALACSVDVHNCTLNIGSGRGMSVKELAALIIQLVGKEFEVKQNPIPDLLPRQKVHELIADTHRAREILGWEARTSMEDGLRETILWMNQSSES
jgi:nucleoside-diphosphate-sugar epimerase